MASRRCSGHRSGRGVVVEPGVAFEYRIGGLDRQVSIPHSAHICHDQAASV